MYEELVLQHNLGRRRTNAVELRTRLAERSNISWSWICLMQETNVVRGNVCGLGSTSSTWRIECKSAATKDGEREPEGTVNSMTDIGRKFHANKDRGISERR